MTTLANITIPLNDVNLPDPSETLNVQLSSPGKATLGTNANAEVDILPAISLSPVPDRADAPGDRVSFQLQGTPYPGKI